MEKHFIDIGKLSKKKKIIFNHLIKYDLIIFDLDNTIFGTYFYDLENFKNISNILNNNFNLNKKEVISFLLKNKYFSKNKKKLFKTLIKKFNLKKKITEKKLVSIYQNFTFSKKIKGPNLIDLIKKLVFKKKIIMIVTEGNYKRQITKIKLLRINELIDFKVILDGKGNRALKPSTIGLKKYKKIFKKFKSIYIGDSLKDKKLSKLLNIKFYYFDISKYFFISDKKFINIIE